MGDSLDDIFSSHIAAPAGSDAASVAWQEAQTAGGIEKVENAEKKLLAKGRLFHVTSIPA